MFTKKIVVSALIAAGTFGAVAAPLPATAASNVEIYVNTAPPPPRYEQVPSPRRGYVWSPGYWRWSENRYRYVWMAGHWERARPGYVYQAPQWVERDGRWHYRPSRWHRDNQYARNWDRDRDGIPNSRDRDRDGDGVPNRADARPDNPRRY